MVEQQEAMEMPIRVYELADIPGRAGRVDPELKPYLDALRDGKAAGDGQRYETREEASKAAFRIANRARRAVESGAAGDVPVARQKVWEEGDEGWFWAILPRRRGRAGDEGD